MFYPLTTQKVSYTATSAAISNAVGPHVSIIRLIATSDCHVTFAKAPTAVATDMYLAADQEECFVIHPGQKVAAIRDTADGDLYVTEMTR